MLKGKKGLILGIANERSIAWACATSLKKMGASLGVNYLNESLEKRVRPLAESIGADLIEKCDITNEYDVQALFDTAARTYGKIDFIVHSVAYADKTALSGHLSEVGREAFGQALLISAWSFLCVAKYAKPLMNEGGALLTMTYYGSQKAVANYGIMGVAKAALEAEVRYLAAELGQEKEVRVNAISAGPIKTLASSGIRNFSALLKMQQKDCLLSHPLSAEEVGNTAAFLLSPLASAITGQIVYVDLGFSANA